MRERRGHGIRPRDAGDRLRAFVRIIERIPAVRPSARFGDPRSVQQILERVLRDPRYQQNIQYGEPRSGHPEGKVSLHIAELEAGLERLRSRLPSDEAYWKLKFLIHVHDAFKAQAQRDVPILHPQSHASLAKDFAAEFTDDSDLLQMIQFHDENYALWQQFERQGAYDRERFDRLLQAIRDWDLFLAFLILDGSTAGKDRSKLAWFIREVKQHVTTHVDESWLVQPADNTGSPAK